MRHTRSSGPAEFSALFDPELLFRKKRFVKAASAKMADPPPPPPPRRRTVADFAKANDGGIRSSITQPTVEANNWQFPSHVMHTIATNIQFHGNSNENPHSHLSKFLRVCDTFRLNGVSPDAKLLRLFPFTLDDKAALWLESLPNGSITTWEIMREKFLAKYYPPSKSAHQRSLINAFRQKEGESFHDAWERFKGLCNDCPSHGIEDWSLIERFYNGCSVISRGQLDTAAGGNMMTSKSPDECFELFEDIATTSYQSPHSDSTRRGVLQVDSNTALAAQVEALAKIVRDLQVKPEVSCEICRGVITLLIVR